MRGGICVPDPGAGVDALPFFTPSLLPEKKHNPVQNPSDPVHGDPQPLDIHQAQKKSQLWLKFCLMEYWKFV